MSRIQSKTQKKQISCTQANIPRIWNNLNRKKNLTKNREVIKAENHPKALNDLERFVGKGEYVANRVRGLSQMAAPPIKKGKLRTGKGMLTAKHNTQWRKALLHVVDLEQKAEDEPPVV